MFEFVSLSGCVLISVSWFAVCSFPGLQLYNNKLPRCVAPTRIEHGAATTLLVELGRGLRS